MNTKFPKLKNMKRLVPLVFLFLHYSLGFSQEKLELPEQDEVRSDSIPPVEEMRTPSFIDASYIGGNDSAEVWLNRNLQSCPDILSYFESQSLTRTIIKLRISSSGEPSYSQCLHQVTEKIDRSFSRLIESMPNWNAATFEGERTSCMVALTVILKEKQAH